MRYRLLGRTGLRVSEAFLGTMTFGKDWGWGASVEEWAAADKREQWDALDRMLTPATSGGRSWRASMAQDVIKKRPTEIDHMNGHVVAEGAKRGVPTPVGNSVSLFLTRLFVLPSPIAAAHAPSGVSAAGAPGPSGTAGVPSTVRTKTRSVRAAGLLSHIRTCRPSAPKWNKRDASKTERSRSRPSRACS